MKAAWALLLWALPWACLAFAGAVQHPVAPVALLAFLWVLGVGVFARPHSWLWLVPALLPGADFMPWTGWWLWSEFDLVLCTVVAAAYARWAWDAAQPFGPSVPVVSVDSRRWAWGYGAAGVLLLVVLVVGGARGWIDAGGWPAGDLAGYDRLGNTLRVAKSLVAVLVLLPLLWRAVVTLGAKVPVRLAGGVWMGLSVVGALVLWERMLYAGGLDFTVAYRTSAWFWEMHVGGGAIDAYLAMALPVAMWAVWTAATPGRWAAAAVVLLLAVFAVLTTYSRGVYLVALGTGAWLWLTVRVLRWNPAPHVTWRVRALRMLWGAVALEAAVVLALSTFMADRLKEADEDAYQRVAHWKAGASLVQTPAQRWLGLGLGRLPAHYSQSVPGGGFPGAAALPAPGENPGLHLSGPAQGTPVMGHRFGLTQRVALVPGGTYTVRLRVAADEPTRLMVRVCERHLLYDLRCQWRRFGVPHAAGDGVVRTVALRGPAFAPAGTLAAHRLGMFALSVEDEGRTVRVLDAQLLDPYGRAVLLNPGFDAGWAHWMPAAQAQFLPWHLDNLYLENWVERGWLGLGVWCAGVLVALACAAQGLRRRHTAALAWWLVLASVSVLGLVIGFMEVPRVAFMMWLLIFVAPATAVRPITTSPCNINSISPVTLRVGPRA